MDLLRDQIWQFVGVIVAILTAAVPAGLWLFRRRKVERKQTQQEYVIAELKRHRIGSVPDYGKHKKRKKDGILLANISSDFLNQFPVPIGVLAAHLDRIYTPENFGASDWLTVFRRLTLEEYFVSADGSSPRRLKIETPLNSGPQMESWLTASASAKRSIAGLD